MANWNNPTVDSNYITFVDEVKNRDVDLARMFDGTPAATNIPTLTIRWNQSNNRFERWSGTVWEARTIGVSGGGTGAKTPAGARTALELGSMALQNSNAVGVTGGSITGVSFSGTGTLSGNASTASTWQTARTLQIGATGKSVNGSANVTWTAAEIGTSNNTGNTVVTRNSSGGFSAGAITYNSGTYNEHIKIQRSGYNFAITPTTGSGGILNFINETGAGFQFLNGTVSGDGSGLTLNASNLTTGTLPAARIESTETKDLGGDISGTDNVTFYKVGKLVQVMSSGGTHTSSASPASDNTCVPFSYRPRHNIDFIASLGATGTVTITVTTGGRISFVYRNHAGSLITQTSTGLWAVSWLTS